MVCPVLPSTSPTLRIMHMIGSLRMGGAENVVYTILKAADRQKNRFFVLALANGPLLKSIEQSGINVTIQPFKWIFSPIWIYKVAQRIRSLRIDVLHTHLFTTDVIGRVAGSFASVPVVVSTLHAPSTWKGSSLIKNRFKKNIDSWTANHFADGLTATSEMTRLYQIRIGGMNPKKIRTIVNPVLTDAFRPNNKLRSAKRKELNIDPDTIIITKVASLYEIKGHRYLLKAIANVSKKHPQIKLLIIGEGPLRPDLESQAVSLGIDKMVSFLGLRQDIPDLLRATDIFIMSSLSEGISMAILEAMASALPIVATYAGGNVDLITDRISGLLVETKNDHSIEEALFYFIENPYEAKKMGAEARNYVMRHHDAQRIARQYENFYQDLLMQKNHGL